MEQKIRIFISDRPYNLKSSSPQQEEMMRKAGDEINRMIDAYQSRMQKADMVDILSLVALNIGTEYMKLYRRISDIESEVGQLKEDMDGYLEDIEK